MATKESLIKQIEDLSKEYEEIYALAVQDRQISDDEIKNLSYYGSYIMNKRAELTILVEQEKNPKLSREQLLTAIGDTVYKSIVQQYKTIIDYSKKIKARPNFYDIYEWEMMVGKYKISEQELFKRKRKKI